MKDETAKREVKIWIEDDILEVKHGLVKIEDENEKKDCRVKSSKETLMPMEKLSVKPKSLLKATIKNCRKRTCLRNLVLGIVDKCLL